MKRIVVFLLMLFPLAGFAHAQTVPPPPPARRDVPPPPPPPPPPSPGKWWKNSEIVRSLALSDVQVNQLETVYLNHQPRLSSLRDSLLAEEDRLRVLLAA